MCHVFMSSRCLKGPMLKKNEARKAYFHKMNQEGRSKIHFMSSIVKTNFLCLSNIYQNKIDLARQ